MPMLDTFSFVKAFRAASTDDDRAAAIAALVNDTVVSHNNGAATRSDLSGMSADMSRLEQKLDAVTRELSGLLETHLGGVAGATTGAHDAIAQRMGGDIARVEQRLDAIAAHLEEKAEADKLELKKAIGNVIGWSFVFAVLTGVGVWIALTWPHALEIVNRIRGV